ncbi:MAG: MarR family transcriptional regulator [Ruminococcaceae bacterium]|nr:MarR family transcriptional regulator [Oscillospiraceae bacterium]
MKKERIGFEISHCARLIRRYMDANALKSYIDEMTGTHGWALRYFYQNRDRDVFQKDFEKEFDIRRSTASNILALMEKNGLITRQSVAHDARLKKIVLTQKALELHQRVDDAFFRMEKELSEGITDEEKNTLFEIIEKINNNIERMAVKDDKTTE